MTASEEVRRERVGGNLYGAADITERGWTDSRADLTVDTIMNSSIAVVDARPGNASYGGQDIPTYDLTVAIAVKRN